MIAASRILPVITMVLSSGAHGIKILYFCFLTTSSILIILRIFIRSRKPQNFGADDCFLLAALASFTLFTIAGLMSVRNGIGSGPDIISDPRLLSSALRFWFMSEIFHICTITLLRLSFSLQLRKLAKTSAQRCVLLTLMSMTILYNAGFFLVVVFQCAPIQYFWTGWVGEDGVVVDRRLISVASYGFAGIGAGIDWSLVLISPWFFWEKDMARRMKYCLRILLVLGICAGTAALIRIPTTKALLETDNFFLDCVPIAVGSILESGLGIVALAASTFKPVWPSFFAEKPKQGPILLMLPHMDEKRSLESSSSRESSSVTGAQVPAKPAVLRKVSDDKLRDGQ